MKHCVAMGGADPDCASDGEVDIPPSPGGGALGMGGRPGPPGPGGGAVPA